MEMLNEVELNDIPKSNRLRSKKIDSFFKSKNHKIDTLGRHHDVYGDDDKYEKNYHVVDRKTDKITIKVHVSRNGKSHYDVKALKSNGRGPKAHELYHSLLKNRHVGSIGGVDHSPGAVKVWQRLAKKKGISVHGWLKNKPVNLDPQDEMETHSDNTDTPAERDVYNTRLIASYHRPKKHLREFVAEGGGERLVWDRVRAMKKKSREITQSNYYVPALDDKESKDWRTTVSDEQRKNALASASKKQLSRTQNMVFTRDKKKNRSAPITLAPVPKPKLQEMLDLTDDQRVNAKNNKMNALVRMHPKKFLELTTQDDEHVAEIKRAALPVHQYNKFSHSKETLVAPFLRVDHRGKVTGHEGRHRAAALLNAGHDDMHVYLKVRDNDARTAERDVGFGHVPSKVVGQHGRGVLDKNKDVRLVQNKVGKIRW